MKLTRARVTNYKSIDDSGWVNVSDVTCLVGKNESGKTAFLHALKKLNPVTGDGGEFDLKDYPRKGYVKYKRVHKERPAVAVAAEFQLGRRELDRLEAELGPGALRSPRVVVTKGYDNCRRWEVDVDEHAIVRHILASSQLPPEVRQEAEKALGLREMVAILRGMESRSPAVAPLVRELEERFDGDLRDVIVSRYLEPVLPLFVYFDEYSTMRGRISIQDLRRRAQSGGPLDDADRTFMALLSLVGADLEDLEEETNYEYLKAELESASISITDEVFEFWHQNRELRVEFDLSAANPKDPPPLNEGTILHVRIWNNRHRVSVPFDERSKGFVWFFSFLTYFSQLEDEDRDLILLLDEPGLNLHALAQNDFLRFIDDRLAPRHQVLYTTHSPFMINVSRLARVRTVEDTIDRGTVITDDIMRNNRETVFPLRVALGNQVASNLFRAPYCLLVGGPEDQVYLHMLNQAVIRKGGTPLDPRWVVIPIGDPENLPTFVALLGEGHAAVAAVLDPSPQDRERLDPSGTEGFARRQGPVKVVEVMRARKADLEDLLDPDMYLELVNGAYADELNRPLTLKVISDGNPRIVQRVEAFFMAEGIAGGHFDRLRPAQFLLENQDHFLDRMGTATLERASALFQRVNAHLPGVSAPVGARSINGSPVGSAVR